MRHLALILAAAILTFGLVTGASAAIVTYEAFYDNVGLDVDPRPWGDVDAEAALFAAAIVSSGVIDFESLAEGPVVGPLVLPGVTLTLTNGAAAIRGSNDDEPTLGYDTTLPDPGDSTTEQNHLRIQSRASQSTDTVALAFAFDSPVSAFGAYFTGTQSTVNGSFEITFDDGMVQVLDLTDNGSNGGVFFFGFTDPGASISSITINEILATDSSAFDVWGIDDVSFGAALSSPEPVPEPGTLALLGVGMSGLALRQRRRR